MHLELPLFRDGTKLFERDLFGLAWYALGCARWAAAGGAAGTGFVAPPANLRAAAEGWNGVDWRGDAVCVRPLFMLSDGLPFVAPAARVEGAGERLYAKLCVARAWDKEGAGYRVEYAWDDANPNGDKYAAVAALAERRGSPADPVFELLPPAVTPEAVPELGKAVAELLKETAAFRRLLAAHAARNEVDRELLMDRLDRLGSLTVGTSTGELVRELGLVVRAARGFFYRLRYKERPETWPGRMDVLANLRAAAVLESRLDDLRPDPASVELPTELREVGPVETAAAGLRAVQRLTEAMHEGGALWRLLSDRSIPVSEEFRDIDEYVTRRYDCLNVARVLVEMTAARSNPRYAFADAAGAVPATLRAIPFSGTSPDGRRSVWLDCTSRYMFLAARRDTSLTVTPEAP